MTEKGVLFRARPDGIRRDTVDLSDHPDLVVIYIGMKVKRPKGLVTLLRFGHRMRKAMAQEPEGLLHSDHLVYGLFPPHVGVRQYWEDLEALETWARKPPHADWWREYLADPGGTGFWHEAYMHDGTFEAIYDDLDQGVGLRAFAPTRPARGSLFTAWRRAERAPEQAPARAPVAETELYPEKRDR